METQSFVHPDSKENISEESNTFNVNDLILALERFKAKHGDSARISLFFNDEELGEIVPYQVIDVNNAFYDYERGDVCNIELGQ